MQGFNMGRYVPPDVEGTTTGNKLHGKHPLGSRARHGGGGLTVRFEMPFPVWCDHCPAETLIGQGVRFNAVKRRVGSYHSTPILSFTLRHAACGGSIEIRTDPQNTDYVVASGGRRREPGLRGCEGESLLEPAHLAQASAAAVDRARAAAVGGGGADAADGAREAAFAMLEKTIGDRAALARASRRVDELADASARDWEDPYTRNARLRSAFRTGRHRRERAAAADAALRDRMSLPDAIVLAPETEYDRRLAAVMDYGSRGDEAVPDVAEMAMNKPLFGGAAAVGTAAATTTTTTTTTATATMTAPKESSNNGKDKATKPGSGEVARRTKADISKARARDNLVDAIGTNLRRSRDPFLEGIWSERPSGRQSLAGLKRKRDQTDEDSARSAGADQASKTPLKPSSECTPTPEPPTASTALVSYDSESD